MTDDLTPVPDVLAAIGADWERLAQIDALIYDLKWRMNVIRQDADQVLTIETRAALATWQQLDELGVDLNLPTLKTFLAATAAGQPTSDGSDETPAMSEPSLPLPSEPTSGEAVTPQSTSPASSDLAAAEPPASPDPYFTEER